METWAGFRSIIVPSSPVPLSSHKLSALVCWVIHLFTHPSKMIFKHASFDKCHTQCWRWWRIRNAYIPVARVCISGEGCRWIVRQFQCIEKGAMEEGSMLWKHRETTETNYSMWVREDFLEEVAAKPRPEEEMGILSVIGIGMERTVLRVSRQSAEAAGLDLSMPAVVSRNSELLSET